MTKATVAILLLGVACAIAAPSHIDDRIVGGKPAIVGQFRHQISMQTFNQHFCGGSILSPTKILTAAHCVYGNNNPMQVVAGIAHLDQGQGQRVDVLRTIYHSAYNPQTTVNDVAVLILKSPLQYNQNVGPISLATSNPGSGATLTLSGWGLTQYPGNVSRQLQYIALKNIDLQTCASQLGGTNPITTGHVCTTSPAGQGACQGDSGGPLINQSGQQVGVVSWGVPCAKGRPDVFTSVAFFRSWIESAN